MKHKVSVNQLFVFIFYGLFGLAVFPASLWAQKSTNARIALKWKADLISKVTDNETVQLINFEGAQYDGTLHSWPRFSNLENHPFPGQKVTVVLKNIQFEPLITSATPDLNLIGTELMVETHALMERKISKLGYSFIPVRKSPTGGALEKVVSFEVEYLVEGPVEKNLTGNQRFFRPNSVLASGNWYKVAVSKTGVYIITVQFLRDLGLDPASVNPSKVRLFGNGGGMLPHLNSEFRHDDLAENAIQVSDGGTPGIFDGGDHILFYGEDPAQWSYNGITDRFEHQLHLLSDYTYYFLTPELNDGSVPKRISLQPSSSQTATHATSTFDDYQFHEVDQLNFIKSGRQWYGEQFDVNLTQSFTFSFPNIDVAEPVYVKSNLVAHSFSPSYFKLNYGSQLLLQQNIQAVGSFYTSDYAAENTGTITFNAGGPDITLALTYFPSTSTSIGYLNYLALNARRLLTMSGSQMLFRDKRTVGPGHITTFNLSASPLVKVWDVTDPTTVKLQAYTSGTSFIIETDSLKEFIAIDGSVFYTPVVGGTIGNQNLHSLGATDYVIISHENFLTEANRLADFHRNNSGLKVVVVTPKQIYNEFSSGSADLIAFRDFLKMFYDRATVPEDLPKYLLLFGDGSYDNKSVSTSNTNFIPTFQSLNSISLVGSYVSDDFFGFLDDTEGEWDDLVPDLLDVGIGRFPVKSLSEATQVVNKTIDYATPGTFTSGNTCSQGNTSSLGDWRNTLCFIADDEDSGLHLNQSNALANYMQSNFPVYNIDKIFLDSYVQVSTPGGQRYPTVNEAIDRRMERGALIINYTGHGGETGWAAERILDNNMIQSWNNVRKLPLFITATCEFSRYDDPGRTSSGELVFINSEAGGVALMSTTRLVYASQNAVLNSAMINSLFQAGTGEKPRLGDAYRLTKNNNSVMMGGINPRNFSLLGDPALRLAYPKFEVVTTQINGISVIPDNDTLSALEKVTISGEVRNNGQKLTGYNGFIYPTVYDKEEMLSTLSNDAGSPKINFTLRKNVLYRGKASVNNGDFSFTFMVPKDIAYMVGRGKLSYYAHNTIEDAHGYYDSVMIGGISQNVVADADGPQVKLYLNDEKFAFGGTTDENPKILALISDDSGVNTVGNGIGHDITAMLNDSPDNIYVLNDYYESDLDSYQSGRVVYPLSRLTSGRYTLKFKVWDINNNSSEAYTEFVVAESSTLALNHVLNYPNPFTTHTSFSFEHNRPCNDLEVQVQIYTVSGRLIKTIQQTVPCNGYRSDEVKWDGRDDFGDRIGRGVYVYRLKIRDLEGASAEKFEKLVVLK